MRAPVTGPPLVSALHLVGETGPPCRVLLESTQLKLRADKVSHTTLQATIIDAQNRPIFYDLNTSVTFAMLSGPAFIDGPVSVRIDSGQASTRPRAGGTAGSARIQASAPRLRADSLDKTDRVEVLAEVRDSHGNLADQNNDQVLFDLSGPGTFASNISAIEADSGSTRIVIIATEPGSLRVEASIGITTGSISIPVISTQPPFLSLIASRETVPADGSVTTQLTAFLRNSQGQLLDGDNTTPVRFSLVAGHGSLDAEEVTAQSGLARVELRGAGISGPLTVRAEAESLETAEIALQSTATAAYRIDLVAQPGAIVADRQSTSEISAVIRDSLGNIVVDSDLEIRFNLNSNKAELIGPLAAVAERGTPAPSSALQSAPGK